MKLPILLALVVAAYAGQGSIIDRETHYAPGKEQTYEYKGQILSGVPTVSQELAGLKIKCNVKIQVQDKFLMELRDVQLCKIQKEIDIPTKQHAVLPDDCEDDSWTNEVREQLQKRIEFQWTKGQISQIKTTQSDPDWSVNVKRGVLELLQVNLEGDEESRHLAMGSVQKYYRVMEQGVGGICESVYNVKAHVTLPEAKGSEIIPARDVLSVTKLRNYHKCQDRPTSQSILPEIGKMCEDCTEERLLTQLAQVRYNITGNRKQFIIDSVIADEKHIFNPFGVDKGQAITFVDQHLIRTEAREIQTLQDHEIIHDLEANDRKDQTHGLKYVFPTEPIQQIRQQTQTEECQPMGTVHSSHPEIEQLLNNIVNGITEHVSEEALRHLHLLREKIAGLNSEELCHCMYHFDQDVVNDAELNEKRRHILGSILPLLGSLHSVEILKRRIESRKIVGKDAIMIVSSLNNQPKPDHLIADTILDLCKSAVVNENLQLKKTCWLAFGSIVHTACKDENRDRCPKVKEDSYMEAMIAGIDRSQPAAERRMWLKAISNAGIHFKTDNIDLLQKVQSIVLTEKDSETSPEIKALAIYSLRHISIASAEQIRAILAPIYRDHSINHEVRIAAFIVIMESEPDHLTMQMLAQDLQKETSRNVGGYVYSHLKTIAEDKIPRKKSLTVGAKEALQIAKKFAGGLAHSNTVKREIKIAKKMSVDITTKWLSTPKSEFGIGGAVKLNSRHMGYDTNYMEVGYHTEHIEEVITQLIEKIRGVYPSINKTFGQEVEEPSNDLRELIRRMNSEVSVTERHPKTQPISASLSIKSLGKEIHDFHLDKVSIEDLLAGRSTLLPNLEQQQHLISQDVFTIGEAWKTWPTILGIPLSISMSNTGILNIQGTGKAVMQPPLHEVLANEEIKAKKIETSGVLNPKIAVLSISTFGASLKHNLKAGVGIEHLLNSSAVIGGNLKLDVETMKLEGNLQLPQHERTLISAKSKPYTYTKKGEEIPKKTMLHRMMTSQQIETPTNEEVQRVINPTKEVEWKAKIDDKTLIAEVSSSKVPLIDCPHEPTQCLFAGPAKVDLKVRPGIHQSEELKITGMIIDCNASPEQYEEYFNIKSRRQHIEPLFDSNSESGSRSFTGADTFQGVAMPNQFIPRKDLSLPTEIPASLEGRQSKENFEWENAYWTKEDRIQLSDSVDDINSVPEQEKPECPKSIPIKMVLLNVTAKGAMPQQELLASIGIDVKSDHFKAVNLDIIKAIQSTKEEKRIEEQDRLEIERLEEDPLNVENQWRMNILKERMEQRLKEKTQNKMVICVQGVMELPETKTKIPLPDAQLPLFLADDIQVKYKLGLQYGGSCEIDKKIQILARATKSKKQLADEAQSATGQISIIEKQCNKDRKQGIIDTVACKQVVEERSTLRALHVKAIGKIGHMEKQVIGQIGNSVLNKLSEVGEVTEVATVNTQHQMTASIDLDIDKFNISIVAPLRNLTAKGCEPLIRSIPIRPTYSAMIPPSLMPFSSSQLIDIMKGNCLINSTDRIITFDHIPYQYELSQCHHILAKDCSPRERFLILARKQEQGRPEKELVIHLAGHKIEIIPAVNNLQVHVDGVDKQMVPMDKLTMMIDGTVEKENTQACKRRTLTDIIRPDIRENGITSSEVYRILTHKHRHRTPPPEGQEPVPNHSDSVESISWSVESTTSEEVIMKETEKEIWNQEKKFMKTIFDANDQQEIEQILGLDHTVFDQQSVPLSQTIIRTSKTVMLFDHLMGLLVITNGQRIVIVVPALYKDMVCGICGHFDNEVIDELQGPSKEIYKQPKQFALSYQMQSVPEQCVTACVPRMTIHQKDEHIDNIESTCYSKVLVPQCKQPCRAAETKRVKIEFVCVPRDSGGSLNEDIQEHRYHKIIRSLIKKPTSFVEEMEIHTRCQQ